MKLGLGYKPIYLGVSSLNSHHKGPARSKQLDTSSNPSGLFPVVANQMPMGSPEAGLECNNLHSLLYSVNYA